MLHVRPEACQFSPDRTRGIVVIESDIVDQFPLAIEELQSVAARELAQSFAAQSGLGAPRINGQPGSAYAINSEGLSLEHVLGEDGKPLAPSHPRMKPAAYRIDVPVCGPIG